MATSEGIAGYLRFRIVNRSPSFYFYDGFETAYAGPSPGNVVQLWNSLGTDCTGTLNYWTTDAGSPTIAANVATLLANAWMHGGHPDTLDCVWTVRLQWNTGAIPHVFIHGSSGSTNAIYASLGSALNTLAIGKTLASVNSNQATTGVTLVNGTKYWLRIIGKGTTYTAQILADSAGAIGASLTSVSATISDGSLQSGYCGVKAFSATTQFGGAFSTVATMKGTPPISQGGINYWIPSVIAGEPAFAWVVQLSKVGSHSLGIYNASASGSGAWTCVTSMTGTNNTLACWINASSGGTATISAGGVISNAVTADSSWRQVFGGGVMSANPTISLNLAGLSSAYFDEVRLVIPGWLITDNLPHPHQASFTKIAMQPHNPGSSTLGTINIPLFPPDSQEFEEAMEIYDQLDDYLRIEAYEGIDPVDIGLGNLVWAGFITGITKEIDDSGGRFVLKGMSDLVIANLSKPFPGDVLLGSFAGSTTQLDMIQAENYFGTNELGVGEDFSPYDSSKYVSSNVPTKTAGTWTADTDDNLPVVKCSTGTGAVLISKAGAGAQDLQHNQYVEVSARLSTTSVHTSNAGVVGVGLSTDSGAISVDAVYMKAIAKFVSATGLYAVDILITFGTTDIATYSNVLTDLKDEDGFIVLTLGILFNDNTTQGVINGKVINLWTTLSPTNINCYPFIYFAVPSTGSAVGYYTNLVQMVKFTWDYNADNAAFIEGTVNPSALHSLKAGTDPGPTFLEVITRATTREGWSWKYTEQPFVPGYRTLGRFDIDQEPGTDLSEICVFSRENGNLKKLSLTPNDDPVSASSTASAPSGNDGGGRAVFRDIASMTKYGVLDDEVLFLSHPSFAEQRQAAYQVISNKVLVGANGSKTAILIRDPETVGRWREQDFITIHEPKLGLIYKKVKVIAYSFTEGSQEMSVTLDQFSNTFSVVPLKRGQIALWKIASGFANR